MGTLTVDGRNVRVREGATVLEAALDAGLQQLQSQGVVLRAYQQSGFHHPAVAGWTRL